VFKEVISLAPDNYRGYSDLGAMYVLKGQFPDAIAMLEKSVTLRPNAAAYNNLGNAYFSMRKFDEAAHDFEEGLKFEKNNWLGWGNLADAYYWAPGKRLQAGDAYREAIRLADEKLRVDPRDARTWAFRATYQAMTDNKPEALASLQKALSLEPARASVQFRAALVYNHLGDTDRTLQSLRKAAASGLPANLVNETPDFDHLRSDPRFRAILPGAK
jgi:tetratricopeptide (TPR) repeat protein